MRFFDHGERARATDEASGADEGETLWRARAEALEAELAALRAESEARLTRAEVTARALRAGMIDPDGVRLLDLSGVRLGADGEVRGADEAVAAARAARPWLFASPRTANPEPPPRPRDMRESADARRMNEKEYEAARRARAWRR